MYVPMGVMHVMNVLNLDTVAFDIFNFEISIGLVEPKYDILRPRQGFSDLA
jgi:hypothetical protein